MLSTTMRRGTTGGRHTDGPVVAHTSIIQRFVKRKPPAISTRGFYSACPLRGSAVVNQAPARSAPGLGPSGFHPHASAPAGAARSACQDLPPAARGDPWTHTHTKGSALVIPLGSPRARERRGVKLPCTPTPKTGGRCEPSSRMRLRRSYGRGTHRCAAGPPPFSLTALR